MMNAFDLAHAVTASAVDWRTASIATPVDDTDLKTVLRRLYVALGGHRGQGGYDPTAAELRDVATAYIQRGQQDGEREVRALMAKAGATTTTSATAKAWAAESAPAAAPEAVNEPAPALAEAKPAKAPILKPATTPDASALANMLAQMMSAPQIDEAAVRAIVDEATGDKLATLEGSIASALASLEPKLKELIDNASRRVEISVAEAPAVTIQSAHRMLEPVLKACVAGVTPMLVGPAGSGKTTLARQIAEALGRPFYMAARVSSEYKLTGFIDAAGNAVRTDFRRAFEEGGVFLFDEIDASDADALTAFNGPLALKAGEAADFPDGQVKRHADFIALGAANTFGRGASREYVGRQQLDAATLDRFAPFVIDYDEKLELAIAGNADWTRHVQKVRAAVEREKIRAIVSPRASIEGAKLLAAGLDRADVEEACIWKGMDEAQRNRVVAAL